jgi:hypothetical protein
MQQIFAIFTFIVFSNIWWTGYVFAEQEVQFFDEKGAVLTKEERVFGLVRIYSAARQHFPNFDKVPELDWDGKFKEYLPLAEEARSLQEYYRILGRFAALLEDGHTRVLPPGQLQRQTDNLPFTLDHAEQQWVVTERWPTEEIIEKDIPPGTVVVSVGGVETGRYFRENLFAYIGSSSIQEKRNAISWRRLFRKGTEQAFKLRYPDGTVETRIIRANRESAKWTPQLREKYLTAMQKGPDFSARELDDGYLYVRYGSCNSSCEKKFVGLIESMDTEEPRAMIVDLRKNGGGSTPMDAVRHLISEPIAYCSYRTRCSISFIDAHLIRAKKQGFSEDEFMEGMRKEAGALVPQGYSPGWLDFDPSDFDMDIEPADRHYDGRLVLLINSWTASAAEDFAVLLHSAGRATIVGERSGGSTGQLMFIDLPGGGVLELCSVRVTYPDGREFAGVGIRPDVPVRRTIEGIAQRRDEVLEKALDYLRSLDEVKRSN